MEIVGQANETTLICLNNFSPLITTKIDTGKNFDASDQVDSFKQLFLLNLNDQSTINVKNQSILPNKSLQPFLLIPIPHLSPSSTQISHVSLRQLQLPSPPPILISCTTEEVPSSVKMEYSLLTVVYHRLGKQENSGSAPTPSALYYSAYLYLLEMSTPINESSSSASKTRILEKLELIKEQKQKLQTHILPCSPQSSGADNLSLFKIYDAPPTPGTTIESFVNRILVLHLQESITIYRLETTPFPFTSAALELSTTTKIEILSSESIPKCFSWAQWNPTYQFLAFIHKQKSNLSPTEFEGDYSSRGLGRKGPGGDNYNASRKKVFDTGILSVYQFHSNYPRESVLNFPLPKYEEEILTTKQEFFKPSYNLTQNPYVLTNSLPNQAQQLRLLAHSSGIVYLFQLLPTNCCIDDGGYNDNLKYIVHMLHHNKSLTGRVLNNMNLTNTSIKVDVCLLMNGQFLAVVGWPLFIHILDIGLDHEPSHHLIFDALSLNSLLQFPASLKEPASIPLTMICSSAPTEMSQKPQHYSFQLIFNNSNNLQVQAIELNNSSLLRQLVQNSDMQFKLNILHFLLIHLNDANAVKRMIYDAGQTVEHVGLTKLFQEFLVANSFNQTKKQLLPNMKTFLHLLPYCPFANNEKYEGANYKLELKQSGVQVSIMLLSPNQRIFPHTVEDVWTALYEVNGFLAKNKRFSHKIIADKLLVSLQCYKPEVLSRTSTPMSPSSPMIWSATSSSMSNSFNNNTGSSNDINPFTRRSQELQLPFIEHESCTANKQEFIYSINLRELSMHLLKERKDCPVHGHTIGGKYVNSLVDTARLLCHLICLIVHLQQPIKTRDKGFRLIDSLNWDTKLRLFLLFEHFSLAMGILACPLPNGFVSFFAYLGYRVLQYDQFLWHVTSGSFELQIDLVKTIMADLNDLDESNVKKKLHLISLLSKSRASRVLNSWSHPKAICIRARQHSSDLLNGRIISNTRRSNNMHNSTQINRIKLKGESGHSKGEKGPLDTFFKLLMAKANPSDIDLALLTEATVLSMKISD